jgi:hypothetical protein
MARVLDCRDLDIGPVPANSQVRPGFNQRLLEI